MSSKDNTKNVKAVVALQPQSITSDTTTVGEVVDTAGYESCTFVIATGSINDANLLPAITECDTSGGSYTAVADGDLIGTELLATLENANDADTAKIGYRGSQRYVKLSLVSTSTVGANLVGAVALLGHARDSSDNASQTYP